MENSDLLINKKIQNVWEDGRPLVVCSRHDLQLSSENLQNDISMIPCFTTF